MKQLILFILVVGLSIGTALAQETDDADSGPETTVQIFFVVCEDQAVINLTGVAQPGFDIFYQVFSGSSGTGDSLTTLRRANVDGDYAFSEQITYRDGKRVAPGAIGSARVLIATTSSPENPTFETTVDDIQDGCNSAQNPLQTSDDAGDPVSEEKSTSNRIGIANPEGGILNPALEITPEPVVVLGPRRTDLAGNRTANPGVIFAQCNSFWPETDPGLVYDSDNVRVFWYWFAKTPEILQENLSKTEYRVKINSAPIHTVQVSPITQRGNSYYVFYTVPVGNLRPGYYEVEFKQSWTEPINDGYDDYGPGTPNPSVSTNCNFKVEKNPFNASVQHSGLYIGGEVPSHNYEQELIRQQVVQDYLEQSNVGQPGN